MKRLTIHLFDPARVGTIQRRQAIADQAKRVHADAYEAAGLSHEDAMAAAQNPGLARSLLATHRKRVHFDSVTGAPTIVGIEACNHLPFPGASGAGGPRSLSPLNLSATRVRFTG
jgi:hypothetical protein